MTSEKKKKKIQFRISKFENSKKEKKKLAMTNIYIYIYIKNCWINFYSIFISQDRATELKSQAKSCFKIQAFEPLSQDRVIKP